MSYFNVWSSYFTNFINIFKCGLCIFITLIIAYFSIVFGELIPKRIAMQKTESLSLGLSGLLSVVAKIFSSLMIFLSYG